MADVATPGMAVTYVQSTREHVPATIVGPSTHGADSLSCSDSGEDDEGQIVWAKAGRGIWGLGHVFEGKLYFTKDIVDDSFVPRNPFQDLKPCLL